MSEKAMSSELFRYDGKPALKDTIPLALQHVVAMIAGCMTPALIIAGAAGLEQGDKVILIQMSLVMSAVATLIMLFPLFGVLGARLPVIIGASFAYVPTMSAVAGQYAASSGDPVYAIGVILGAQMVGGLVAVIFGLTIKWIRPFFPPLVTGTVVFVIGLSLYSVAMKYMGGAGNVAAPGWGAWQNWLVAIITLAAGIFFNHFTKGIFKLSSVLFAMLVGYIVSIPFGMVNLTSVGEAGWFAVAPPLYFAPQFEAPVIISFVILFIVNAIQAIGDFTSTTVGGMDRVPTEKELKGGIIGYGVTNILCAAFGCPPTATYSQNVGIVAQNRVISRQVFTVAAIIILIAGVCPKISAILTTIPYPVIGGATLSVFAMITMNGIRLIAKQPFTPRNLTIVGLSVAAGMGFTAVADMSKNVAGSVEAMGWISPGAYTAFGTSPVVLACLVAVLLNIILKETDADRAPEDRKEQPAAEAKAA